MDYIRERFDPPCILTTEHHLSGDGSWCVVCGLILGKRRTRYRRGYGTKARADIIRTLIERDGFQCWYCYWPFEGYLEVTIDHVIPRAKGGPNDIDNYRIACYWCNHNKGDYSEEEFRALPKFAKRCEKVRELLHGHAEERVDA